MWIFYFLLVIGATQEGKGEQDSGIHITGTGNIGRNGKTVLNIQVSIQGIGSPEIGMPGGERQGAKSEANPDAKELTQEEFTTEEETGLTRHNIFRAIHKAPPMKLDRKMCDDAKAYAEKIARTGRFEHSSKEQRDGQGENLSMGCSPDQAQAMETAVENWYNEVCNPGYNFTSGAKNRKSGTGHFTQVVWKETTTLGIGRAEVQKGDLICAYIVGRYKPAGNILGSLKENVPKGDFNSTYCATVSPSITSES